ncbi:hypothetical protein QFB84_14990 [Enterobacter hormaechei]|nr:hypothetical protein QFB84_14990 [Enterobacter hormaechei]
MSTLTKKWLQQTIAELEEEHDAVPGVVNEDAANALVAMKLALASLEAEPVVWLLSGGGAKNNVSFDSGNAYADPLREVTPLYTAPPAPVSVPEWTNEQCLEFLSIAFRHAEIKGDLELDDIRLGVKMVDGSRAAMLQGAEPVSNRDELPLDYLQGQKDALEWAAQLAEANHPHTGDWLYDDPLELAKAIRKGPDMSLDEGNAPGYSGSVPDCSNAGFGTYEGCVPVRAPSGKIVDIDACLVSEVIHLWQSGITTIESCCGHNKTSSYIAVVEGDAVKMRALGYELDVNHPSGCVFYSKTSRHGQVTQANCKLPMQPLAIDVHGTLRFKENPIVRKLLDYATEHGYGLNEMALEHFDAEDGMQLAQLIGYSLSGYGTLSYVTDESYERAASAAPQQEVK